MDQETRQRIDTLLDDPSIYPDRPRKSREQREADLLAWLNTYGEVLAGYNLYGLDLVDAPDCNEYLDGGVFRKQRYEANSTYIPGGCTLAWNLTTVTRDKVLFEAFADLAVGPKHHCYSYGLVNSTGYYAIHDAPARFEDLVEHFEGQQIVVKPAHSGSGVGVFVAEIQNGAFIVDNDALPAHEFLARLQSLNHPHLLQRYLIQHEFMKRANPSSVNTIRILSWHTGDAVHVDECASLRFGKPGVRVDNIDAGGSLMFIDENGLIGPDAFNLLDRTRFAAPLAGETLPYWTEVRAFVERIHAMIPGLFTVGWDIALTPDGPLVIEGNDGWGLDISQIPLGKGLRPRFEELLARRKKFFAESTGQGFWS